MNFYGFHKLFVGWFMRWNLFHSIYYSFVIRVWIQIFPSNEREWDWWAWNEVSEHEDELVNCTTFCAPARNARWLLMLASESIISVTCFRMGKINNWCGNEFSLIFSRSRMFTSKCEGIKLRCSFIFAFCPFLRALLSTGQRRMRKNF